MYVSIAAGIQTKQFIISFMSDKNHLVIMETASAEMVAGKSFNIGDEGEESKKILLLVFLAKKSISIQAATAEARAKPIAPK